MLSKKTSSDLPKLSKRESQIMDLLYTRGPSTVAQVTDHFPEKLSRNAIRTFLGILEGKGHLSRTKEGREFKYLPVTDQSTAAQSALSKVLDVFFKGSLSDAIAAQFQGNGNPIKEDELARLEALIAEARKKN